MSSLKKSIGLNIKCPLSLSDKCTDAFAINVDSKATREDSEMPTHPTALIKHTTVKGPADTLLGLVCFVCIYVTVRKPGEG